MHGLLGFFVLDFPGILFWFARSACAFSVPLWLMLRYAGSYGLNEPVTEWSPAQFGTEPSRKRRANGVAARQRRANGAVADRVAAWNNFAQRYPLRAFWHRLFVVKAKSAVTEFPKVLGYALALFCIYSMFAVSADMQVGEVRGREAFGDYQTMSQPGWLVLTLGALFEAVAITWFIGMLAPKRMRRVMVFVAAAFAVSAGVFTRSNEIAAALTPAGELWVVVGLLTLVGFVSIAAVDTAFGWSRTAFTGPASKLVPQLRFKRRTRSYFLAGEYAEQIEKERAKLMSEYEKEVSADYPNVIWTWDALTEVVGKGDTLFYSPDVQAYNQYVKAAAHLALDERIALTLFRCRLTLRVMPEVLRRKLTAFLAWCTKRRTKSSVHVAPEMSYMQLRGRTYTLPQDLHGRDDLKVVMTGTDTFIVLPAGDADEGVHEEAPRPALSVVSTAA